ncbi:MAG TPA: fimbrial protein [Paraburkholderia sp.]|uniref:fimbrial protein n=1 Tax=Paraburkholderia sp. TaxID=1926495 RepID=UPI002ED660E8
MNRFRIAQSNVMGNAISSCMARAGSRLARKFSVARFLMVLMLSLLGGLSAPAHANIQCEIGNVNLPLAAGTVSIPTNVSVGQTLATLTPSTFQMNCQFVTRVNNGTSATNVATFGTASPAPGFTDVYPTNVPGVGVRYTFNSAQCNATNVVMTNGSAQVGCYFSGPSGGPYVAANITVTSTLVVTSPIASGTSTLSSAPAVSITFTSDDQTGSWVKSPLFTGAATGTLVHATCSVNQSNVSVILPTADTRAFSAGVGAVAAPQPFQLSLTCAPGSKVSITLTDNVDPTNRSNTLKLSADSTAQGVGIQVLNGAGPVSFGPDSAAPGNANQWLIGDSPAGALIVPVQARYVRTGAVTPGSVKALATFTMSYQ